MRSVVDHHPPILLRGAILLFAVASAFLQGTVAVAQSGWLPTSWFSGGEIDPQAMYPLAEKDGPWLVLAKTFRGEGARDDARGPTEYESRSSTSPPSPAAVDLSRV
jgi:hypothetical protein